MADLPAMAHASIHDGAGNLVQLYLQGFVFLEEYFNSSNIAYHIVCKYSAERFPLEL
jgi:hypothetical protein